MDEYITLVFNIESEEPELLGVWMPLNDELDDTLTNYHIHNVWRAAPSDSVALIRVDISHLPNFKG